MFFQAKTVFFIFPVFSVFFRFFRVFPYFSRIFHSRMIIAVKSFIITKQLPVPPFLFHRLAMFLSNQVVIMHIKITETIAFVELKYLRLYKKWHEADFETDSKSKLLYPCCKRRAPLVNLFRRNASIELESLSGVKDKQRSMDAILQKAVLRIHARLFKVLGATFRIFQFFTFFFQVENFQWKNMFFFSKMV